MPTLKLEVQINEEEAKQIKSWQAQGLADSDDELLESLNLIRKQKEAQKEAAMRKSIFARTRALFPYALQALMVVGLGILIWQLIILRQTMVGQFEGSAVIPVRVVDSTPIEVKLDRRAPPMKVQIDEPLDVQVTNEPDVHVTNPTLDVRVENTYP